MYPFKNVLYQISDCLFSTKLKQNKSAYTYIYIYHMYIYIYTFLGGYNNIHNIWKLRYLIYSYFLVAIHYPPTTTTETRVREKTVLKTPRSGSVAGTGSPTLLPDDLEPTTRTETETSSTTTPKCPNRASYVCSIYITDSVNYIGTSVDTSSLTTCIIMIFSILTFVCVAVALIILICVLLKKKIILTDSDMARVQRNSNSGRRPSFTDSNNIFGIQGVPMNTLNPPQRSPTFSITVPQ